jgi:hypothetical protein
MEAHPDHFNIPAFLDAILNVDSLVMAPMTREN